MSAELFCLHGFLGAAEDWDMALPQSSWGAPVRKLDWLEAKPSDWNEAAAAVNDWAGSAARWDSKRVLVGYSMGGRVALHALLKAPEFWDAAVILSAHPGLESEDERQARLEQDRVWAKRFQSESWDELMKAWDSLPVFGGEPNPLPRAERPGLRGALASALEKFSLGKQADLRASLFRVEIPILWMAGERDGKYLKLARDAAGLNRRFRFIQVDGAGHRAPWTARDRFFSSFKTELENLLKEETSAL